MPSVQVTATDADAGPLNNKLVYSLAGNGAGSVFDIDSATGEIRVIADLQYESSQKSYSLTVQVRDEGTPSLNGSAPLVVNILDRNDNAPVFGSLPFAQQMVREDAAVNTEVFRFSASDADAPNTPNSQIAFSVTNTQGKFALAAIDATTQRIILSNTLDYESAQFYSLKLEVNDMGTPRLSSHTTLNVTVLDVNDFPPVFQQPTYTRSVRHVISICSNMLN